MLIPVVCFSCGQCIAHLYERYKRLVEEYSASPDNIPAELSDGRPAVLPPITPEEAALNKLGVRRMCCRRMFLAHCDTYHLVNTTK